MCMVLTTRSLVPGSNLFFSVEIEWGVLETNYYYSYALLTCHNFHITSGGDIRITPSLFCGQHFRAALPAFRVRQDRVLCR